MEKIGVEKALRVINTADLILFVLDGKQGFEKEQTKIFCKMLINLKKDFIYSKQNRYKPTRKVKRNQTDNTGSYRTLSFRGFRYRCLGEGNQNYVNKTEIDTQNQVIIQMQGIKNYWLKR